MSRRRTLPVAIVLVACALAGPVPARAQIDDSHDSVPEPVPPPPLPPPTRPKGTTKYVPLERKPEVAWGTIDAEMLASLQRTAGAYAAFTRKFVCDETVRTADYKGTGEVADEKTREYYYLLTLGGDRGETVRELRQEEERGGYKPAEVKPAPFPPAYAWAFLFSEFHAPYFDFRHVDTYFDGFELVHEIEFKGSIPFQEGQDIRQWEGTVLVDAFKHIPLEVRAEPKGQQERLAEMYRLWTQSWNILGFRTKETPYGHRAVVAFGYFKHELSFPTRLRYEKFRAVGPGQVVPSEAATHSYARYQFTNVEEDPRFGDVVKEEPGN
jgi:hypothetical protein